MKPEIKCRRVSATSGRYRSRGVDTTNGATMTNCERWFCGGAMDGETGLCYECAEKAKKEEEE